MGQINKERLDPMNTYVQLKRLIPTAKVFAGITNTALAVMALLVCNERMAMAAAQAGQDVGGGAVLLVLLLIMAGVVIYFIPSIIASSRDVCFSGLLFIVNLLFGWSIIGWFVCLIWAAVGSTRDQDAFYKEARNSRAL